MQRQQAIGCTHTTLFSSTPPTFTNLVLPIHLVHLPLSISLPPPPPPLPSPLLTSQGLFTGIGKGVVGTFTKPVVGILDFASSTTAAIRETTSRVSRVRPDPVRLKRNCVGLSGALTPYQPNMARAQTYLRLLAEGKLDER